MRGSALAIHHQWVHSLSHNVSVLYPEKRRVRVEVRRVPPWKEVFVLCLRVTNKGKSGVGKASDKVEANDRRP